MELGGNKMTKDELTIALERWGSDIARWPEPLQDGARKLVRESSEAQSKFECQRQIENGLALIGWADQPSHQELSDLKSRIMTHLPARPIRPSKGLGAFWGSQVQTLAAGFAGALLAIILVWPSLKFYQNTASFSAVWLGSASVYPLER